MDIDFHFIGWQHQDNHDKCWVAFKAGSQWFCAWGRRGAKLQFKVYGKDRWGIPTSLRNLTWKKQEKGYKPVEKLQLFVAFPDFEDKVAEDLAKCEAEGKLM